MNFKVLYNNLILCPLIDLFLQETISSISGEPSFKNAIYLKLQELPWDIYLNKIKKYIEEIIDQLPSTQSVNKDIAFPSEGLAGLFFFSGDCGDDPLGLSGSLYFDEPDWAAEADYYPNCDLLGECYIELKELVDDIITMNKKNNSLFLSEKDAQDLFFSITAYIIFCSMKAISNKEAVFNSGIAIGYCDWDGIMLGNFINGTFLPNFKNFDEDGFSKPARVYPSPSQTKKIETGPIWDYILHNYWKLLKEENLYDKFRISGEEYAKEIAMNLQSQILINKCNLCGNIKKTPKARLCLQCGVFTDDLSTL